MNKTTIGGIVLAMLGIILLVGCNRLTKADCLDVIFPETCTEIDELCKEEFLEMCELTCPEIININKLCDGIFEARCEDADCYCNDGPMVGINIPIKEQTHSCGSREEYCFDIRDYGDKTDYRCLYNEDNLRTYFSCPEGWKEIPVEVPSKSYKIGPHEGNWKCPPEGCEIVK